MGLFMELEVTGRINGAKLQGEVPDEFWTQFLRPFSISEHMFNAFFLVELAIRVGLLRRKFFWDFRRHVLRTLNCFDAAVVTVCCIDVWVISELGAEKGTLLRLLRCFRFSRALKIVRALKAFAPLRVLMSTIARSFFALIWSMVLLGLLVFLAGVFLCQAMQSYILDEEMSFTKRTELFRLYGRSFAATWTMFEATFSGCWPNYAEPVVKLHWGFMLFYAIFVSVVVFAITRIITALFLKDTLVAAAQDADMMVEETLQKKKAYANKLNELFRVFDTTGDGTISLEEFESLLERKQVLGYLSLLELEVHEVMSLFRLLDVNRDGVISHQEFTRGIMLMRGQARSMDVIRLGYHCEHLVEGLTRIESHLKATVNGGHLQ